MGEHAASVMSLRPFLPADLVVPHGAAAGLAEATREARALAEQLAPAVARFCHDPGCRQSGHPHIHRLLPPDPLSSSLPSSLP